MSSPSTRDLMNDVAAEIPAKWRDVGIQLGLSPRILDNIQSQAAGRPDSNMHAFEQVFEQWQRQGTRPYTWRTIIDALKAPAVGERALANDLEVKHAPIRPSPDRKMNEVTRDRSQEILSSDINFSEKDKIGDGGQAAVYRAFWRPQKMDVAVKVLIAISNAARREIETLRAVKHKNIAQLYGVYENKDGRLCLVLERAQTSLDKHLKQCIHNFVTSLDWSIQVAEGLRYLHYGAPNSIVHGDLKSLNVLVYPGNVLKITDFGCAKFQDGTMSTATRRTSQWCAPELFDEGKHSMESDVYAYGVVLWEIVTCDEPYKGLTDRQIMRKLDKNERLEIPSDCHEGMKRIMLQCWDRDPKKRPTSKTIVNELESKEQNASKVKDQKTTVIDEEMSQWTKMPQPSDLGLAGTPTMPELLSFSAEKLNIAIKVGVDYVKFGIFLLNDSNGVIVNALEIEHRGNAEHINMAILQRWLQGKGINPVTWSTLIGVLRKIGHRVLADDIDEGLKK